MKLNTVIRLGALAFNVAQDEKVRELATMIHHGAKRRGIIGQPQPPQLPPTVVKPVTQPSANIPFAPTALPHASSASHHSPLYQQVPQVGFGKYLTVDNAKKVLGWAGTVSNYLIK